MSRKWAPVTELLQLPALPWNSAPLPINGAVRVHPYLKYYFSQYARKYREEHPGAKLWAATILEDGLREFSGRGLIKLVKAVDGFFYCIPTREFMKDCFDIDVMDHLKPASDGTS